jgi:XTP/dITP diphosphohydrolase
MGKQKLILASNNIHKMEEIKHFIGNQFEILTLDQIGFEGDIEESGSTLSENSMIKAQYIFDKYQQNCLADDSGLEVLSLNNEPGVYSARYGGPQRNHEDNMNLLLKKLEGKTDQSAQFRTVITLIFEGKINQFEGVVKGKIINKKKGEQGFGYDPIFVPDGYDRTFAQMSLTEKNGLSHRTKAIEKMIEYLSLLTKN